MTTAVMADNPWWRLNPFAGFSRHFWAEKVPKDAANSVTWVNRWYNPKDLRDCAPLQTRKFPAQPTPNISSIPAHWVPQPEAPLSTFSRTAEEKAGPYGSSPSTRCESWSTLRQMLPSQGWPQRHCPPKWGTNISTAPDWYSRRQTRFPHINSPMTK